MRVVFMGSPQFAATILEQLAEVHEVCTVYTRPDAVRGRGTKLLPTPVKETATSLGIPVVELVGFTDERIVEELGAMHPDAICVAAFSALLPAKVLGIPRFGCVNVHASALPRWRGAAPVERAILAGDEELGACIMRMEEGLDTGPYCKKRLIPADGLYAAEAQDQLARIGASLLVEALDEIEGGSVSWTEQDGRLATYADKIERGELDLDPGEPAIVNERKVRASGEAHPSRVRIAGREATLEDASVVADGEGLAPGTVAYRGKRLLLGCADGLLQANRLKPHGKKSMDGSAFAAGVQNIKQGNYTWERYA